MDDLLENNKLIAEFMGWYIEISPPTKKYPDQTWCTSKNKNGGWDSSQCANSKRDFNIEDKIIEIKKELWKKLCNISYGRAGKYNTSWDKLIPVVEKINSFDKHGVVIHFNRTVISTHFKNKINIISSKKDESLINNTYKAVVEFIKWYNENNKK